MRASLEGLRYEAMEAALASGDVNPVHARALFSAVQRKLIREDLPHAEGMLPPVQRWLGTEDAPKLCRC